MDGASGSYTDAWHEYRSISAKLRKRFMRRPNAGEAAREYRRLAARLKDDDQCPDYAALCHLSAARCEQQVGNALAETGSLTAAARLFLDVEEDLVDMQLPNFHGDLASAIHCYVHAIRSYVERKEFTLAGRLCAQLAHRLHKIDRCEQAVEYWSRAGRYLDSEPCMKHSALESLLRCQVESGAPHDALQTADELWTHLCKIDPSASGADDDQGSSSSSASAADAADGNECTGWRRRALHHAHVATVLLLIYLRTNPALMTERHARLYAQFNKRWPVHERLPPAWLAAAFDEEQFLTLNNFVLAAVPRRWDANGLLQTCLQADDALGRALPHWHVTNCELALTIVGRMLEGSHECQ